LRWWLVILRVKRKEGLPGKNMAELCSVTWWKFPDVTWRCVEVASSPSVTIQSEVNFSIEIWVGVLFMICAGILGSIIVELLFNKSDWFITPLVNRVVRRYHYTIERNRLTTMQGHP
jgi:hypothetical protein